MKKLYPAVLALLLWLAPSIAHAQCASYTTVTGTVTDPSGIPWRNINGQTGATVTASITPSGPTSPTCTPASGGTNLPFSGNVGPVPLDSNGSFSLSLPTNSGVQPSGTQWSFHFGIAPGQTGPFGTGPQFFTVTVTVSGSSQSITSQINAAPVPYLTIPISSGGGCPNGGAGCANEFLSNLQSPTAVNQDLLPQSNQSNNIGNQSDIWQTGYFNTVAAVGLWTNSVWFYPSTPGVGSPTGNIEMDANGLYETLTGGFEGHLTAMNNSIGTAPACSLGAFYLPTSFFEPVSTGQLLQYCGEDNTYHYAGMIAPAGATFSNTALSSAAITAGQFLVFSGYSATYELPTYAPAPITATTGVVGVAVTSTTGANQGFLFSALGTVQAFLDNTCPSVSSIISSSTSVGYGHCVSSTGTAQVLGYASTSSSGLNTIWGAMGGPGSTSGGGGGSGGVNLLYANATPVTVSNTTAETTLMSYTLPANTVTTAGQSIHVLAAGNNNNSSGSNANYVYKLYLDSTVIATHDATNAITGDKNTFWKIDADMVFSAVGSSGAAITDGTVVVEQNNNGFIYPATQGATNVTISPLDTTASHTLKVTVTLGTAATTVAPSEDRMVVTLDSGGSVSVNSAALATPNFNSTTPAAPGGDTNCTFQVSGSNVSCYVPSSGSGTVTSVGLSLPSFFSVTGSPITASGTLAGAYNTGLISSELDVLGVNGSGAAGLYGISSLVQGLTGCNTSGNVYTPQANDCVAQSGGALPSGVAGQSLVNNGSGATSYSAQSPTYGVANGGALISLASGTYPIQCDSATVATGILDRGKDAKVGTGGSNDVIIPDLAGTGCGGMYGSVTNATASSTITVSRQTSDTFNVFGPSQAAMNPSQTTFTLAAGQWATFKPSESSTAYDIHIYAPPAGTSGVPNPGANGIVKCTGSGCSTSGIATAHDVAAALLCADSSGSGTAQSCSTSPTLGALTAGDEFIYTTTTTNSGTGLTVNIDAIGAKSIAIPGSSGWTTTLTANVIPANKPLLISYDGTNLNVQQTGTVSAGGGTGGGTVIYTTSQTASSSDNGKHVQMNCSAACAYTLPNPQPSSTWTATVQSIGSTLATVALGSSMTFNGSATAPLFATVANPSSRNELHVYADSATSTNYQGGVYVAANTGTLSTNGSGTVLVTAGNVLSSDNFNLLTLDASNSNLELEGTGGGTNGVRMLTPWANEMDAIAFSTTPAISMANGNVHQFACTTASSSIVPTFTSSTTYKGEEVTIIFVQNGTTACTWTWPSTIHGGGTVTTTLSGISVQEFMISNNGTDAYAIGPIQNMTGGTP